MKSQNLCSVFSKKFLILGYRGFSFETEGFLHISSEQFFKRISKTSHNSLPFQIQIIMSLHVVFEIFSLEALIYCLNVVTLGPYWIPCLPDGIPSNRPSLPVGPSVGPAVGLSVGLSLNISETAH